MQKVYLLRNQIKSGPFTLAELWQQSLRQDDQFWIEGKSTSWAPIDRLELSPAPIESNSPLPETAADLESKADAIRQRALETPPRVFTRTPAPAPHPHIATPTEEEEEPLVFIDHRKQKTNILGEVLMTVIILAIMGGGLLGGRSWFRPKAAAGTASVTRIDSRDEHTAAASPIPVVHFIQPDTQAIAKVSTPDTVAVVHKAVIKKTHALTLAPVAITPKQDSEKLALRQDETPKPLPATHNEERKKEAITASTTTPANTTAIEEPQKKKGLGQALRNLFHKKKKEETADQ